MAHKIDLIEWDDRAKGTFPLIEELQHLRAVNAKLLAAVGSSLWVLNNRHNKNDPAWEEFAVAAEKDCRRALAKVEGKNGGQA